MGTITAASIVAWIVSMPLIALHFEQLNPWAIPASLILGPAVFVSLVAGFAIGGLYWLIGGQRKNVPA